MCGSEFISYYRAGGVLLRRDTAKGAAVRRVKNFKNKQ